MGSENPVHVLLIPSWYATSSNPVSGSFFREQARALARAGHRVGVIAPNLRSVRELPAGLVGATRGIEFEDDDGIATYRLEGAQLLPGLKPANDRAWISAGRKLFARYVAEQGRPDVLHAHATFMAGIVGAELKRESGIPLVITEHSTVYQRRPIPEFQLEEARAALVLADARLVVSPQLGAAMEQVVGAAACPWEWVPNVVDSAFLDAELRSARSPVPSGSSTSPSSMRRRVTPISSPRSRIALAATRLSNCASGATGPSARDCARMRGPSESPSRSSGSARSIAWRFAMRCWRRTSSCCRVASRRSGSC